MFETTNQYIIYSPHDKRTQRLRPRNSETCTVRGAVREKRFQGLRRCSRLSRRLERSGRRSPNPAGAGFGKRGKANFNRGKGGFHEGKLGDITGIQWDIMSCAIYIYIHIQQIPTIWYLRMSEKLGIDPQVVALIGKSDWGSKFFRFETLFWSPSRPRAVLKHIARIQKTIILQSSIPAMVYSFFIFQIQIISNNIR